MHLNSMILYIKREPLYPLKIKLGTNPQKQLLSRLQLRYLQAIPQLQNIQSIVIRGQLRLLILKPRHKDVKLPVLRILNRYSSWSLIVLRDVLNLDLPVNNRAVLRVLELDINRDELGQQIVWLVHECELQLLLSRTDLDADLLGASGWQLLRLLVVEGDQVEVLVQMVLGGVQDEVDLAGLRFFDEDDFLEDELVVEFLGDEDFEFFGDFEGFGEFERLDEDLVDFFVA